MRIISSLIAVASLAVWPIRVPAAPNPPPPPFSGKVSEQLISAFDNHDLGAYQNLFAPNVQVYQDGKLIASNRDEWMVIVTKQFDGPLKIRRELSASSGSQLLVADTLSNFGDPSDGQVHDCCAWARIGRYVFDEKSKIVDVRFFSDPIAYWQVSKSVSAVH